MKEIWAMLKPFVKTICCDLKQILENFPATVTQRRNARQLYDVIGYRMK